MKMFIAFILAIVMAFSLTACSGTPDNSNTTAQSGNPTTTTPSVTVPSAPSTTAPTQSAFDPANWGREEKFTTNDGETIDRFMINVPKYLGSPYLNATISEQMDGTVAFISGQTRYMHSVEKTSDIFTEYLQYTAEALEDYYGLSSSNFSISIDSSESVVIGEYEMYVHKGIITYDYDGTQRTHQYVAYTTKLKPSGNCAYWMVYDFSEDQSKGELIAEHAYHMALTFREEK